jgi:PAS domain S-box-containing protein
MEQNPLESNAPKDAAIMQYLGAHALAVQAAPSIAEALNILAVRTRIVAGAQRCVSSYLPLGDFQAALHASSGSGAGDLISLSEGICRQVVSGKKAVLLTGPELESAPLSIGLHRQGGWLAVPILRATGELLGVLQVSDKEHSVDSPPCWKVEFTTDDLERVVALAQLVWPRFEVHYLNQQLEKRAAELSQAREELQRDAQQRQAAARRDRSRRDVLEQLAKGQELPALLEAVVGFVERESPESICSILLLDVAGRHLLFGAAPRLPAFYNEAIHGIEIGPTVGSCGAAAFSGCRVVAEDIETHPNWAPYRELARRAGLRSCWSEPIVSSASRVLGTFAIYRTTPYAPTADELELISIAAHLTSLAVERNQAETARQDSQRILRMILDTIPQGVFWKDRQSRYLGCNQVVARAFGLARSEDLIGMCDHQLAGLAREQADFFVAKDRQVMETDVPELGIIEPATLADGTTIWMETSKMPLHDAAGQVIGVLGTWQDFTARKRTEEALRESEEQWRMLAANIPDFLCLLDREGTILFINRILSGYNLAEVIGSTTYDYIEPEFHAQVREGLQRCFTQGEVVDLEAIGAGSPGERCWYRLRFCPLWRKGEVIASINIGTDITARKRAEEERRRLETQLQHTQKLESLGILAGGIAHDFNNLLTSILGYGDLALLELPSISAARPLIGEAIEGARRAAELTRQLLAYSGKGRFVVEPVQLSALTEEMSRLLQISISKKCVMKYNLTRELPTIEADAAQMRQIVMNLILNASEAIGDSSGVIAVTTGVMHCDRAFLAETYLDDNLPAGRYVYLEVADTGSGMSEETRSRIFDPFFTTKFTGRGLGLSAVLGIVRGHRGAIKCSSEPGVGTTFRVLFPATDAPARKMDPSASATERWRGRGTVLVVDDEDSVRGLTRHMLLKMGFTVLLADNGRDGVNVYRQQSEQITLVLLDMTMPQLDGEETFLEMRRIRGDVRAILMSGYNEQTATSRFAGKGLAAFLQKPFRFEELQAVVRSVLSEQ